MLISVFEPYPDVFENFSQIAGQPLDTVKVKMQTSAPGEFKNMSHCFVSTLRTEGIARGLYAGTGTRNITRVVKLENELQWKPLNTPTSGPDRVGVISGLGVITEVHFSLIKL